MGVQRTTNFQVPYLDDLTGLDQLDEVTKEVAELLDAAMGRAGFTPPDSSSFADLVAKSLPGSWVNATGQTMPNFPSAPAGQANWSPLSYRKDNHKTVRIRGGLAGGTVTSGQTLFTLPVGFRPLTYQALRAQTTANTSSVSMYVQPDGKVTFFAAATLTNVLINDTFSLD